MPLWKVKDKMVDENGLATTKTITTENTAVMQKLLDMKEEPVKDKSKKNTEAAKKESKNKEPAKHGIMKLLTNTSFKAPTIQEPKATVKKEIPRLRKGNSKKLEVPKKEVKALPEPKKKSGLSRTPVEGKAKIEHHSRNLNSSQVGWSNHNSFDGNRGTHLKNSYESYRHKIEFSGLTNKQKSKLLDKLYKLYEPILRYDSQWYSPIVSGPARYPQAKMDAIYERKMNALSTFLDWWKSIEPQLEKTKLNSIEKKEVLEAEKKKEIERIKEGFNRWYTRLLEELPEYEKNGRNGTSGKKSNIILQ